MNTPLEPDAPAILVISPDHTAPQRHTDVSLRGITQVVLYGVISLIGLIFSTLTAVVFAPLALIAALLGPVLRRHQHRR